MSRTRWALLALAAFFVALLAAHGSGEAATGYDDEELRFLRLVNEYRKSNGAGSLILSDTLAVAAERHSEDMAEYDFFAHETQASSYYPAGSEPWDRMAAEGYSYNTFKGENLAVGCETAAECFELWRNSPSHNAAMLDEHYKVVGITRSEVPNSKHRWYWTTDFGGTPDPSSHAPGEDEERNGAEGPPEKRAKDAGGIENGEMNSDGGWEEKAKDGADLLLDGRARLGGYDRGEDDLRQKVRIGANTRLSYRLDVEVAGGRDYSSDRLTVRLLGEGGRPLQALERHTEAAGAGGWEREGVDLSRFAGRTVYLSFHAETDGPAPTAFYLDDVTLAER